MTVTQSDIQAFSLFAQEHISRGAAESLVQLAQKWSQERDQVVRAVQEGEAELAAGGGRPAAEVVAEIRERLRS